MKTTQNIWLGLVCALLTFTGAVNLRAEPPITFKVGDISFTRPGAWEWVEVTSPMRKAQLAVKNADETADVVFYYFGPGQGGDVDANVERWLGQFAEPREEIHSKIEKVTVGMTSVTYVQAEGTFQSGMPGGPHTPMPGYALLGAVVESAGGNVFVKMTGPKKLVASSKADFKTLVESGLKQAH